MIASAPIALRDHRTAGMSRARFREFFQPSRILIGLLPAPRIRSGYNPVTLCFSMWASYHPRMMAIAIQDCNYSFRLLEEGTQISLSIPGIDLVEETILFGTESGRDIDKLSVAGVALEESKSIDVPGLAAALGGLEMHVRCLIPSGDHVIVLGEVTHMIGRRRGRPLLSVGAETQGYTVLRKQGQHRLAVAGHGGL
jgi:flavin reductase (DIM6/NTAB) family NADH-FMN oxidoreductase RutF